MQQERFAVLIPIESDFDLVWLHPHIFLLSNYDEKSDKPTA
jgi:hypothetical protein